ncbi:MAG: cell division protein FtsA [Xanthobacteraceae bacterium]|nr:cell division protein FtsA [Xanthobacteraceae bacterium]MBX3522672.1 cell division protein FtsA [Xanthobacteraceae bacterium]MBX3533680.1 cell division protein FtsA [Xanthobacteraceae bacterium]MBX3548963.1 cell division protein FtsA [Xanthobacteraceae bacterium]MCW5675508.1 cell division protein FtsA [Xanthobacteraceae bacterium]
MNALVRGLAPRMKPLGHKRSSIVAALDIGTSKVACVIAKLKAERGREMPHNRTHSVEVIGFGHTRAHGIKAGTVVDIEAAEESIRRAVDQAERSAKVEIASVIVSVTGGRLGSESFAASVRVPGNAVEGGDIARVLDAASVHSVRDGRAVLHSIPIAYHVDDISNVQDPRGMLGRTLAVDLHVATADYPALQNLILCVERCHLSVEGMIAAPYAAGLAALSDDEAELGATVIDLGAGTTTLAAFVNDTCVHMDGIAVGSFNVTLDLARGLSTKLSEAERIKTLYGDVIEGGSDHTDLIMVPSIEGGRGGAATRAQVIRIARARIDEIFEMLHERLSSAGILNLTGRRIVLTGGGALLGGVGELASRMFGASVRIGTPRAIGGLNNTARSPVFAAVAGLAAYPQFAEREHFEPRRRLAPHDGNYLRRVGRWIKESF